MKIWHGKRFSCKIDGAEVDNFMLLLFVDIWFKAFI